MIIKDTGVGISQEGIKNLFVDFNKLEENQQRNTSGTGLGLSICKRIVEQMGGVVNVESTLGVGTEFHIDLRAKTKHIVAQHQILQEKFTFIKQTKSGEIVCAFLKNR